MLTVKEVAKELGVHQNTIFRHLNNGNIKGVKIGGVWRVDEKELEKLHGDMIASYDKVVSFIKEVLSSDHP